VVKVLPLSASSNPPLPPPPTLPPGFEGSAAADVVSKLTTSGKPLSAVAFGYDKPAYRTEAMERHGVAEVKLHQPYVPALRPRFVKDHPALAGAPTAAAGAGK
jgi:hypothetical protein